MATAQAANKTEAPQMPQGMQEGGRPDIEGWYAPEVNNVIHGKIKGHLRIRGDQGERDVVCVELFAPCQGKVKGEDKARTFDKGQVIGLGISSDLKDALEYVEHRGEIWACPLEKKKLDGGRTMWKYKQGYKGKKAPLSTTSRTASTVGDDDDIPF